MRDQGVGRGTRAAAVLGLAAILAACASDPPATRAPVEIRGSNPSAVRLPPGQGPVTSPSGVITYDGYQAVTVQSGETVANVADRIGVSASELAAYNGLRPEQTLRAGDELVLPPRPGGYSAAPQGGPAVAGGGSGIEAAPLGSVGAGAVATATPSAGAAPAAGAPAGDTWSPDLAAAAIERSVGLDAQGNLALPPSAANPVPTGPDPTAPALPSPDLGQYQTPSARPVTADASAEAVQRAAEAEQAAATELARASVATTSTRLIRPVEGPIALGFNKGAGPQKNDGVDFAAPAGTPVVAAADGEVALVSQSLGGLGTILLVRHPGDLLTVYGRIDGVTVAKGDRVRAGQRVGVVSNAAAPAEPRMHFEVRKGAESVDPTLFF